jgi:acyl CoA:acetate/3-ketoacid CoA transferase beta subunit
MFNTIYISAVFFLNAAVKTAETLKKKSKKVLFSEEILLTIDCKPQVKKCHRKLKKGGDTRCTQQRISSQPQ